MSNSTKQLVTQFNKITKKVKVEELFKDPVLGPHCRMAVKAADAVIADPGSDTRLYVSTAETNFFWLAVFILSCKKLGAKAVIDNSDNVLNVELLVMNTPDWQPRASLNGNTSLRKNNILVCFSKDTDTGLKVDVREVLKRRYNMLYTHSVGGYEYTNEDMKHPLDISKLTSMLQA